MLRDTTAVNTRLSAKRVGTHMSHRIAQFYLPPDRGNVLVITPTAAGTHFIDPTGRLEPSDHDTSHPARYASRHRTFVAISQYRKVRTVCPEYMRPEATYIIISISIR